MRLTDGVSRTQLEILVELHVPGTGKVDIQSLGQGLINDTYRVTRDGIAYALRATGSTQELGLDRRWEARVLGGAVRAELAPALAYCDPERGILISRWVDGRSWTSEETQRPANLSRMAELMRRIHGLSLPVPTRVMTPGQWADYYSAAAGAAVSRATATPRAAAGAAVSGAAAAARAAAATGTAAVAGAGTVPEAPKAWSAALRSPAVDRLNALAALPPVAPVVCHSDLHTLNLLDRGGSLMLLDWEYAHASDPFWDLAAWSANNDFGDATALELLAHYVGRTPTPEECLRLRHLSWLYDFVCLLWSELYLSVRGGGAGSVAIDSATSEVCARARLLAGRLHAQVV